MPGGGSDEIVESSPDERFVRYAELLGSGSFKSVYRGFDQEKGIEIAWNQVKTNKLAQVDREELYDEVRLLQGLRHPNIIVCYAHWRDPEREQVVFITELMTSGTLKRFVSRASKIKLNAVRRWCIQILEALHYLHDKENPIIHRDLKCENIFINGNSGEVKIGDMGLSTSLRSTHAQSVIGTPEFMAPELYDEKYDQSVDIYAFGMCVIEMLTNDYPYSECKNAAQIYKKVMKGTPPAALDKITSPEAKAFIYACLSLAESRPSASQLLSHAFLKQDEDDVYIGPGAQASSTPAAVPSSSSAHRESQGLVTEASVSSAVAEDQAVSANAIETLGRAPRNANVGNQTDEKNAIQDPGMEASAENFPAETQHVQSSIDSSAIPMHPAQSQRSPDAAAKASEETDGFNVSADESSNDNSSKQAPLSTDTNVICHLQLNTAGGEQRIGFQIDVSQESPDTVASEIMQEVDGISLTMLQLKIMLFKTMASEHGKELAQSWVTNTQPSFWEYLQQAEADGRDNEGQQPKFQQEVADSHINLQKHDEATSGAAASIVSASDQLEPSSFKPSSQAATLSVTHASSPSLSQTAQLQTVPATASNHQQEAGAASASSTSVHSQQNIPASVPTASTGLQTKAVATETTAPSTATTENFSVNQTAPIRIPVGNLSASDSSIPAHSPPSYAAITAADAQGALQVPHVKDNNTILHVNTAPSSGAVKGTSQVPTRQTSELQLDVDKPPSSAQESKLPAQPVGKVPDNQPLERTSSAPNVLQPRQSPAVASAQVTETMHVANVHQGASMPQNAELGTSHNAAQSTDALPTVHVEQYAVGHPNEGASAAKAQAAPETVNIHAQSSVSPTPGIQQTPPAAVSNLQTAGLESAQLPPPSSSLAAGPGLSNQQHQAAPAPLAPQARMNRIDSNRSLASTEDEVPPSFTSIPGSVVAGHSIAHLNDPDSQLISAGQSSSLQHTANPEVTNQLDSTLSLTGRASANSHQTAAQSSSQSGSLSPPPVASPFAANGLASSSVQPAVDTTSASQHAPPSIGQPASVPTPVAVSSEGVKETASSILSASTPHSSSSTMRLFVDSLLGMNTPSIPLLQEGMLQAVATSVCAANPAAAELSLRSVNELYQQYCVKRAQLLSEAQELTRQVIHQSVRIGQASLDHVQASHGSSATPGILVSQNQGTSEFAEPQQINQSVADQGDSIAAVNAGNVVNAVNVSSDPLHTLATNHSMGDTAQSEDLGHDPIRSSAGQFKASADGESSASSSSPLIIRAGNGSSDKPAVSLRQNLTPELVSIGPPMVSLKSGTESSGIEQTIGDIQANPEILSEILTHAAAMKSSDQLGLAGSNRAGEADKAPSSGKSQHDAWSQLMQKNLGSLPLSLGTNASNTKSPQ